MHDRNPWRRWTSRLSWAFLLGVVVAWLLLITTSESFLPATLLAYGPRFPLASPLVILVPVALVVARSALLPLAISALVIVGPIMGGRVSLHTLGKPVPAAPPANALRVVTYNSQGGRFVAPQIRYFVETHRPDLMAFQECGDQLMDSLRAMTTWYSARYGSLCTASRWPITSVDTMPRRDFARIAQYGFGGSGMVVRYNIQSPRGPLTFVNLHLETARKGLQALSSEDGLVPDEISVTRVREMMQRTGVMERISMNAQIRERESERASVWALRGDKLVPAIIVGDFNLPVESAIFRRHWGGFTDAFEASGTGFGWTKREGTLLRIRIDHIVLNSTAPTPIGTWLGPDMGSDHVPVIADLQWPSPL
jgi:endonuclease/exonuclease/phosphatase (EEP) superfamily protein YafD